jgi:transcriptional regulator with XRE-family HTH domain
MDRALLADFLRARRAALQPEEAGLPRGSRRRTGGLRREEVAVLAGMSADYYSRLEQQRGPMPSEQMLAALARALRLSPGEREHRYPRTDCQWITAPFLRLPVRATLEWSAAVGRLTP